MVHVDGYDSNIQEMYFAHGAAALRRGYNCLLFDGPGQGRKLIRDGLPIRPDWENVVDESSGTLFKSGSTWRPIRASAVRAPLSKCFPSRRKYWTIWIMLIQPHSRRSNSSYALPKPFRCYGGVLYSASSGFMENPIFTTSQKT